MSTSEDKTELRSVVRMTRAARAEAERELADELFAESIAVLADQFSWGRIAAFVPTPSEPPIVRGIDDLVSHGVTVIVPVSSDGGLLEWVELTPGSIRSTMEDSMRMPIPTTGERVEPGKLDAVLVPAAAVDRDGNRLGWGKGYYDRFLATVTDALVIAVVFDADVFDQIPTEEHDKPVDGILTESTIAFV